MTLPKRHHFVPQFYLRKFSRDGKSICCFNKRLDRLIARASIKGQCAIDNFYGWADAVEPTLGFLEGHAAEILKQICLNNRLPKRGHPDFETLLIFVALQSARTQSSGRINDKMTDHWTKIMLKGRKELENIDLDKFYIKNSFSAALPIEVALKTFGYLSDLNMCLLLKEKGATFYTSDNPVAFYNSAFSHITWEGVTGFDCSGLEILFPLGPNHCLFFFDKNVYSGPKDGETKIVRNHDVIKCNIIQILASDENVYLANEAEEATLRALFSSCEKYLNYDRVTIIETEMAKDCDDKMSSLLIHYRCHPPVELSFSFSSVISHEYKRERRSHSKLPFEKATNGDKMVRMRYRIKPEYQQMPREHLNGYELKKAIKAAARTLSR